MSNLVGELNKPLAFCQKTKLCDKQDAKNDADNENLVGSSEELKVFENTEEVPEKLLESRKEETEVVDEVETIEKIAEMIATVKKEADDNSFKIKKRINVLMSRNESSNICNSSDDNVISNSFNAANNLSMQTVKDQPSKKRKICANSQKIFEASQSSLPETSPNKITEEPISEKIRFEEIEDKLEEMFAGIEDEELTDEKNLPQNISDSLDKSLKKDCIPSNPEVKKDLLIKSCDGLSPSVSDKSLLPAKSVEKCETTNKKNLLSDYMNPLIPKPMMNIKNMPPQRRLSIGMKKEFLKLSANKNNQKLDNKCIDDTDEEIMASHLQTVSVNREVKPDGKSVSKNRKISKQKQSCKYKKELNYVSPNKKSNKKMIHKCEASNKAKHNQQKLKEKRLRLIFSENETDEKQFQTKDVEYKNRSPFILVKNNGNISVVNTVAPDDVNEKFTKLKKPYNYAYERKTVKGCYSSTLGNRYDADTADSSWKCVFCKLGPHKKKLGDLFGPYVISSDCDEYRSAKDSLEKYQRNETHVKYSNSSLAFIDDASNYHDRNIDQANYEDVITNYTSGMSRVSADSYEIWVHEDCAVWAPNIFVVGSRLAGLEEATWKSTRYECAHCLKQGALLCCLQRGCKTASHVPCAHEFKWLLDESNFWVYCNKHTINNILNKNLQK